jgi:hypothetical protein
MRSVRRRPRAAFALRDAKADTPVFDIDANATACA